MSNGSSTIPADPWSDCESLSSTISADPWDDCVSPEEQAAWIDLQLGSLRVSEMRCTTDRAAQECLDAAWRLNFVAGLAHGVRALHQARIIHRDVKNANVELSGIYGPV